MRPSHAAWTLCAIFAFVSGVTAQEPVRLEYKLKPATELIYKASGTESFGEGGVPLSAQKLFPQKFSGTKSFFIADLDATGTYLIGQLPLVTISANAGGSGAKWDDVSVCRMDCTGHVAEREWKGDERFRAYSRPAIMQYTRRQLDVAPLPAGPVAVGATWESETTAAANTVAFPSPAKVSSTFAAIETVDGHPCALIRSKLSPWNRARKDIEVPLPDALVTGEVETIFDIEGGFSRSVTSKVILRGIQPDRDTVVTIESSILLDSMKTLPPAEAASLTRMTKAFDAAVTIFCDGEPVKADATLKSLDVKDLPDAWKTALRRADMKGFAQVMKSVTQIGKPVYVKISVSDKASLYLQIAGDELRMATSGDGLEDAPAIKAIKPEFKGQPPIFLKVPLAIPADLTPPGMTGAQLTLTASRMTPGYPELWISGKLETNYADENGTPWTFDQQLRGQASGTPETAPIVGSLARPGASAAIAKQQQLALRVNVMQMPDGTTGIEVILATGPAAAGVEPKDGEKSLNQAVQNSGGTVLGDNDIRTKDGTPLVSVRILDKDGKEVKSDKGPLSKFGFSWGGGPCYSVRVAKGEYTVEASLYAGPLGGLLKATKRFVVK